MDTERLENVLFTIDKLGLVTLKQLHNVMKVGSYRYTCKILSQLEKYLHVERSKYKMMIQRYIDFSKILK